MPAGRPTKLTPALIKEIGEAWLLAFTDEETAILCGISIRSLAYWRKKPEFLQAIKREQFQREKAYRRKIFKGQNGWQGAAWFFERTRPTQFSRPEVQLNVNNDNRQIHQTLVIQAEVAGQINDRVKATRSKIGQLLKDKRPDNPHNLMHYALLALFAAFWVWVWRTM